MDTSVDEDQLFDSTSTGSSIDSDVVPANYSEDWIEHVEYNIEYNRLTHGRHIYICFTATRCEMQIIVLLE